MTQQDRVLWLLRRGWVCGSDFLDERLPRYGARICELRQLGYMIERRQCVNPHHHHRSAQWEWRLTAEPRADGQITVLVESLQA